MSDWWRQVGFELNDRGFCRKNQGFEKSGFYCILFGETQVRSVFFLPTKQCEADTTHWGEISDPPHVCLSFRRRATCQGQAPGELKCPPTIRLSSKSLFRNLTPHLGSSEKKIRRSWADLTQATKNAGQIIFILGNTCRCIFGERALKRPTTVRSTWPTKFSLHLPFTILNIYSKIRSFMLQSLSKSIVSYSFYHFVSLKVWEAVNLNLILP